MKKCFLMILMLFILSGCSVTNFNNYSHEQIIDKVLSLDIDTYNKIGNGYKYYAPYGVVKIYSKQYNDILMKGKNTYYLYVDVVSYYYKNDYKFKENSKIYLSKDISTKNKKGYVNITKDNNKLYVEMMYNYAKIETYVEESELNNALLDISYILSSINFNDSLLKKLYEAGSLDSKAETYNLFENKDKKGNFLKWVEEYDKYEGSEETDSEEGELILEETPKEESASEVEKTTDNVENETEEQ